MYISEGIDQFNLQHEERQCRLCGQFILNEPGNLLQQILNHENIHIIQEFDSFIWGVGLGQIVPGYTLLIPKRHICALSMLNASERLEFLEIMKTTILPKTEKSYGCLPLIFEHGSSEDCFDKAGSCIDHAHLHIFPVNINVERFFTALFPAERMKSIDELFGKKGPYLFQANLNESRITFYQDVYNMPSQFLRMVIKKATGSTVPWDWKRYAGVSEMKKTSVTYKDASMRNNSIVTNYFGK